MTVLHPTMAFLLQLALDEAWLDTFAEQRVERALKRIGPSQEERAILDSLV